MSNKDLVVCKNFRLVKKLGTGAFGEIYLAENRSNKEEVYAAKLEDACTKFPQLHFEAKIYKYLSSSGQIKGIPKIHYMTTEGKYNVMLMDLLGKSLEDLFVESEKKFSLKTVLMIGEQMVDRIEQLHEKQILHRDIKPDNFLMGLGAKRGTVYIVDLGLSKKYIKDGKHIPYKEGKELTGTARYASINTHMGLEQSRRDDVESIGYVLMYLLRGILPWQNMKAKDTKAKYKLIMEKKMSTPAEVLCKGFPKELADFINYAKGLKFEQRPDYDHLRGLIAAAKASHQIKTDYVFDWSARESQGERVTVKKEERNRSQQQGREPSRNPKTNEQQGVLGSAINTTQAREGKTYQQQYQNQKNNSRQMGSLISDKKEVKQSQSQRQPDYRNSNSKLKMSSNQGRGFDASKMANIEAVGIGSKITGPKISVIKR